MPPWNDSLSTSHTLPASANNLSHSSNSCVVVGKLLQDLQEKIEIILHTLPLADEAHQLAVFAEDPASHISLEEDDWEDILNPMMH